MPRRPLARPSARAALVAGVIGLVVLLGAVALLSPSRVNAGEDVANVPDLGAVEPPNDAAHLIAPESIADAAEPARVALEPEPTAAVATPAQETYAAHGTLVLPASFPRDGQMTVQVLGFDQTPEKASVDEALRWRIPGISAGDRTFRARAVSGDRIAYGSTGPVRIDAESPDRDRRIVLAEYVIEGVLTDDLGAPIPNALVDLDLSPKDEPGLLSLNVVLDTSREGQFVFRSHTNLGSLQRVEDEYAPLPDVYTDTLGRFRAALPGPGTVTLTAPVDDDDSTPIGPTGRTLYVPARDSVELSFDQQAAWIALSADRATGLSGTLASICSEDDAISVFARDLDRGKTHRATATKTGDFDFGALPPGPYRFYARHGGDSGQDYCYSQEIRLLAGVSHRLNATLMNASSITGTVLNMEGIPVKGVTVTAKGADNPNLTRRAKTDSRGVFVVDGLYASTYVLTVNELVREEPNLVTVPGRGALVDAGIWRAELTIVADVSPTEQLEIQWTDSFDESTIANDQIEAIWRSRLLGPEGKR